MGGICAVRADGSGLVQLTTTAIGADELVDTTPTWSPNGRRIAFSRSRQGGAQANLYVMRSDGTHLRRLTFGQLGNFSPN